MDTDKHRLIRVILICVHLCASVVSNCYELRRFSCRDGTEYGRAVSPVATSASVSRSKAVPSVTGSVPGTMDSHN